MSTPKNQDPTTNKMPLTGRTLELADIEALALGAWILGTGGGGDPYHKLLNMRELYKNGHTVELVDPMSLNDDALVAVLSNMGAPLVGQERLADPAFAIKPVRMMERYLGRAFDAVMALEIGGGNGVHPMLVAALSGYPVIDADTMGRAYPEAQMTSVAVSNLQCFPLTLADIRDNEIIIPRAASWRWMERISRKACTEIGSIAATCKAPGVEKRLRNTPFIIRPRRLLNSAIQCRRQGPRTMTPSRPSLRHVRDRSCLKAKSSMLSEKPQRAFFAASR